MVTNTIFTPDKSDLQAATAEGPQKLDDFGDTVPDPGSGEAEEAKYRENEELRELAGEVSRASAPHAPLPLQAGRGRSRMPEPEARPVKMGRVAAPGPAAGRILALAYCGPLDPYNPRGAPVLPDLRHLRGKQGAAGPQEDCQEGVLGRGAGRNRCGGSRPLTFYIYKRLFLSQGGVSMQVSILSVISLVVTADKYLTSKKHIKLKELFQANQAVAEVRNHLHNNMELFTGVDLGDD